MERGGLLEDGRARGWVYAGCGLEMGVFDDSCIPCVRRFACPRPLRGAKGRNMAWFVLLRIPASAGMTCAERASTGTLRSIFRQAGWNWRDR